MESLPLFGFLPTGLVAFLVALVVITVRRALEGGSGLTFADLATAVLIGVGTTIVQAVTVAIALRRFRGSPPSGTWASRGVAGTTTSSADRFDRFSDEARVVLTLAQDEAQRLKNQYIDTEHILLALLRQGGITIRVLARMGVDPMGVRTAVLAIVGRGQSAVSGEIGLRPHAKRTIELAIDEARTLEHRYIGTEHLLLGLVREGEGIGARVLKSLGVTIDRLRPEVIRELGLSGGEGGR